MPIFSKKYGRQFRSRSELMRYERKDRQTKPIFSWGGLRDAPYSDQWRREHGLKTREERREGWRQAAVILWFVAGFLVLLAMCGKA